MRLMLAPAILVTVGGGAGLWLGGLSNSSDKGTLSYWDFMWNSEMLEGDMDPREEHLLLAVRLRAIEMRLEGGGTSSLRRTDRQNFSMEGHSGI